MDELEKHKKRMEELFIPIERQILMTDDNNDLKLLSALMLTSSKRIFMQQFGKEQGKKLMKSIIDQ